MPVGTSSSVSFGILGPLEVFIEGQAIELGGPKQRAILSMLLIEANRVVSLDRLADQIWNGEPPPSATGSIQAYVSNLRRVLEPNRDPRSRPKVLVTKPPGYSLVVDPDDIDSIRFEGLLTVARSDLVGAPGRALRALDEALTLWRGQAHAEFAFEPFARAEHIRLEELRWSAVEAQIEALLARGDHLTVIAQVEAVLESEPLRERLWSQLMIAMYRAGRQADALEAFKRARQTLSEQLGIDPGPELQAMERDILRQSPALDWTAPVVETNEAEPVDVMAAAGEPQKDPAQTSPANAARLNLPTPSTPLIGRARELDEVMDLIGRAEVRLLTLTGVGGVGKTRLATEAARQAADLFPDGVAFVALAPLHDSSLVVSTIAGSLGLGDQSPREALLTHLREKQTLLLLDNFEQVVDAAPDIAELIERCPFLVVLTTSRAPLRARGEHEYPVPPLELPVSTVSVRPEDVLQAPSARLFTDRARATSPSFRLTEVNASAVAAICWRLAGLPLALELAAAKVRFLDPATLLERLDRALSTGGARDLPARQRTMRATLDWSHELLSSSEKELFRSLAVFAGGFTLEAAEGVGIADATGGRDVLAPLGRLVEQSLVTVRAAEDDTRYGMLEPVRQYAFEKLEESRDADDVHRRHAAYYLALAERAGPELRARGQIPWLRRLETELDNMRAALKWSAEHDQMEAIALSAWASWSFWWLRGHPEEGRRWMEIAMAQNPLAPPAARAKLLYVAGTLAQGRFDWEPARLMLEESRTLFREVGDGDGYGHAVASLGLVSVGQKQHERGLALLEEAIELFLEHGQNWSASHMMGFAAGAALSTGEIQRARQFAKRGLSLAREVGAREALYVTLYALAAVSRAEGDRKREARLLTEGLTLSAEVEELTGLAYCLEGLAAIAASENSLERAALLSGAAERLMEDIEVVAYVHTLDRSLSHRELAAARERLDPLTWERACARGRAMSIAEAVAEALADQTVTPRGEPQEASPSRC